MRACPPQSVTSASPASAPLVLLRSPLCRSQNVQKQLEQQNPELKDKCHFFNSFFYKRLHNAVGGLRRVDQSNPESLRTAYDAVKRCVGACCARLLVARPLPSADAFAPPCLALRLA